MALHTPATQLPPAPPTDWPLDAEPATFAPSALAVANPEDRWTTWQVAAVAMVGVLVGLAVGVATGMRLTLPEPTGTLALTESETAPPVQPVTPAASPGSTAAPSPPTPEEPVPFGTSFLLDGHSFRVLSTQPDPADGQLLLVRIELVVDGSHAAGPLPSEVSLGVIDGDGGFHAREAGCGSAAQVLDGSRPLEVGEAVTGQVCFAVPDHLVPGSVLEAEIVTGHPVHFALG